MTDQSPATTRTSKPQSADSPPLTTRQSLQASTALDYHDLLRSLTSAQRTALLLAQVGGFKNELELRALLKILDQVPATLAAYERFILGLFEADRFDDE